jgi:hypothetical protein
MYERFIHLFDYFKADPNRTTDEFNGKHGTSIDNPSIYARGSSKVWTINKSQKTQLVENYSDGKVVFLKQEATETYVLCKSKMKQAKE